ncbi:MAG: hypothetical protein ACP5G7_01865 [Anaerolineae bacterium]
MQRRWLAIALLIALVLPVLTGCGPRSLLHSVSVRPSAISPNADGVDDVAEIKYALSDHAIVSIYLIDDQGNQHVFRDQRRRSKGERTAYFSGVIGGSLLPDGTYTLAIEVEGWDGHQERQELTVTLVDGDKVPMRIEGLSIWPASFTPNRDGITDRVTISYNLSKEAARVEVYILGPDGEKYPVPEDEIREAGSPGAHEHDYDAGIDLGATPPPDGMYTVVVEAEDLVGNKDRVEGQLEIQGGGVPMVEIVNAAAEFSPLIVPLGETLTFTCTVKNIGTVPVRTKGPEPGTTYTSLENFNTLGEYEEPGIFRVGLDFEGNSEGRIYPYRWQLGTDEELTVLDTSIGPQTYLMPDQTVTVVGHLRITQEPVKAEPYFWIGLIHESVWIVQDRIEATPISIGF